MSGTEAPLVDGPGPLLTDRVIATPRYKITDVSPTSIGRNGKQIRLWLGKAGIKYYLY